MLIENVETTHAWLYNILLIINPYCISTGNMCCGLAKAIANSVL